VRGESIDLTAVPIIPVYEETHHITWGRIDRVSMIIEVRRFLLSVSFAGFQFHIRMEITKHDECVASLSLLEGVVGDFQ
jgi:hypothetical protein